MAEPMCSGTLQLLVFTPMDGAHIDYAHALSWSDQARLVPQPITEVYRLIDGMPSFSFEFVYTSRDYVHKLETASRAAGYEGAHVERLPIATLEMVEELRTLRAMRWDYERLRAGLACLERTLFNHDELRLMDSPDGDRFLLAHGDDLYDDCASLEEMMHKQLEDWTKVEEGLQQMRTRTDAARAGEVANG